MIFFGWDLIVWWQGIEPNVLNLLYDNIFPASDKICLLGFGWTILAFDNISGCFYSVNSAITVFTLANNLKHWYFVSWLNTDGYFTSHFLIFRSRQTPVMLQCYWCAELYVKKFHHAKSDFPWHSCTWTSTTGRRLGRRRSFSYGDLFSSFFSAMLVYYFLQEDKLWKKKDVLHKFAFLLYNLCYFSLSLLFSFAPMPTMPKITRQTEWRKEGSERRQNPVY